MLNMFCPKSKVAFMSKTVSIFVQKVGLSWLQGGFYFSYSGHKYNCWLKIVNHWDKRDHGVMCAGKEIKPGLKLVRMETDISMQTCNLLLRKKLNIGTSIFSFENCCEMKVCPKLWAYFTWKSGWLETGAGTNVGPQNNTYLSAPDITGYHFHNQTNTDKLTGNYSGTLLLFSAFHSGMVAQCENLFMSAL